MQWCLHLQLRSRSLRLRTKFVGHRQTRKSSSFCFILVIRFYSIVFYYILLYPIIIYYTAILFFNDTTMAIRLFGDLAVTAWDSHTSLKRTSRPTKSTDSSQVQVHGAAGRSRCTQPTLVFWRSLLGVSNKGVPLSITPKCYVILDMGAAEEELPGFWKPPS